MTDVTIPPVDNTPAVATTTARLADAVNADIGCGERDALDWLRASPAVVDQFGQALVEMGLAIGTGDEPEEQLIMPVLHGYQTSDEEGYIVIEGVPSLLLSSRTSKHGNFETRFPEAYRLWLESGAPYAGAYRVAFNAAGVAERLTSYSWEIDPDNTEDGEIVTWQAERDEYIAERRKDEGPPLVAEGTTLSATSLRHLMDAMANEHGVEWSDADEVKDALLDVWGIGLDTTLEVKVVRHA